MYTGRNFTVIKRFTAKRLIGTLPILNSTVLEVSGADARKFLQGLCTNDLTKLVRPGTCMPATFLTAKGRIFANSLLYLKDGDAQSGGASILIELPLPSGSVEDFRKYLTTYKLRSKVTIKPAQVQCSFTPSALSASDIDGLKQDPQVVLAVQDPRIDKFGSRILKNTDSTRGTTEGQAQADAAWYDRYKLVHGFAEGPEVGNRIPLECNLDLLHYISFAKGCYVGQELTARTKFKGLVRKRLVPFLLAPDSSTSSTRNTSTFEPISAELKSQLVARDYGGLWITACTARVATGALVYADSVSVKSIGEVVHVDSTGTIGVAMLQQASLLNTQGNFIVRPRAAAPAAAGSTAEEVETESVAVDAHAPVAYISTYRPDWFQGLDERTGNVLDL